MNIESSLAAGLGTCERCVASPGDVGVLPTAVIIGSAKCATTSLHYYLNQHPDICMSQKKECHFFCHECYDHSLYLKRYRPVTTLEAYSAQFKRPDANVRGESSPMYLYFPRSAANIRESVPDARLIAVLRDPADRAFSAYVHMVRDGLESLSFEEALEAEAERVASGRYEPGFAYAEWGYYASKLRPYYELFAPEQILVLSYKDVVSDMPSALRTCCEHLGVSPNFEFDVRPRLNVSGVPRRRWLHNAVQRVKNGYWLTELIKRPFPLNLWIRCVTSVERSNLAKLYLADATRRELLQRYREDASALYSLTGHDFYREWKLDELD